MSKEFPHINDTKFPILENIDVYKYKNNFDYTRWDTNTKIKVLNVNFSNDYENVVKFESDLKRDIYFDQKDGHSFTLNSALHLLPNGTIKLPIPFNVMSKFNYLYAEFPVVTSEGNPINYEDENYRIKRFYFFVTNIIQKAPNTTECTLDLDMWTTFINSVDIDYMILERGHAPMKAITTEAYLKNPLSNNKYLLAPDVNYDTDHSIVVHTESKIWNNGDMWICFVSSSQHFNGNWGAKDTNSWNTPADSVYVTQGAIGYEVFAINPPDLITFMNNVETMYPNFKQTIQGIFVINKSLIYTSEAELFCGVWVHKVNARQQYNSFIDLKKSHFNFESKYENIAKLYTYPYSYLEYFDEQGDKTIIKVEETTSDINIISSVSLFFPYIKIDSYLEGIGSNHTETIEFKNVETLSFKSGGKWVDTLKTWNIPIYGVVQSSGFYNSYNTFFDRQQMANEYNRDYNNSIAYADTSNTNSIAIANTNKSNVDIQIACNTAILNYAIGTADLDTYWGNQLNIAIANYTMGLNDELKEIQATQNTAKTGLSAVGGAASGAVTGAIAGSVVPGVGTGIGAIAGAVIGGLSSGISAGLEAMVANNALASQASAINNNIIGKRDNQNQNNTDRNDLQNTFKRNQVTTQNNADSGKAINVLNTDTGNANRTRNTEYSIALTNKNTAIEGVNNQIRQANLGNPMFFGEIMNGETHTVRPQGVFCNVITQPKGVVAMNGDTFLKYGYYLHQQWNVDDLNVMKHFTYWKAEEMLCILNNGVIEEARDIIKKIFLDGVIVWKNEKDIGQVSIYDNWD